MIKRGDLVEILPEFQDAGDSDYTWMAVSDVEKGRLDISPIDHSFDIKPVYTVLVEQVTKKTASTSI